jgi:hypothetical protein
LALKKNIPNFLQQTKTMNHYDLPYLGIRIPLFDLELYKDDDGWIVLQKPGTEFYLSVKFLNHFFNTLDEAEASIQNEIKIASDSNDLYQVVGVNRTDDETVTGIFSQYINNTTHLVHHTIRIAPDNEGYWYMAVTKDEAMIEYCDKIFNQAQKSKPAIIGKTDAATAKKLAGHTLQYLHSYNSGYGSGGGMSTQQSFELFADGSFRYKYESLVSFGSLGGGNTSRDSGWGMWEVQKNDDGNFLVLRWHLKAVSVYALKWGDPGIIYLNNEKYLLS